MSVDLNKLIAKKSYLVPIKASEICEKLLKELNISDHWVVVETHPRSATFKLDYREKYANFKLAHENKQLTQRNLTLKRMEFDTNPFKWGTWVQEQLVNEVPAELRYIVSEENLTGCIVRASCKPVLYYKITRQIPYPDSDLQNVRIQCEEFLDHVFIGGLGAKEMPERGEVSGWKLLINDVHNRQITEKIYEMLRDATTCVLLMGWVGTDCLPKLKELKSKGVTIRSITHKPNEFKSPVPADIQKGYGELIELLGLNNISVNPLLHGRALIVDNKALIGSMDFNSHSLSGQHVEFAIYTEDADTVRSLRSYFESIFKPLKETEK